MKYPQTSGSDYYSFSDLEAQKGKWNPTMPHIQGAKDFSAYSNKRPPEFRTRPQVNKWTSIRYYLERRLNTAGDYSKNLPTHPVASPLFQVLSQDIPGHYKYVHCPEIGPHYYRMFFVESPVMQEMMKDQDRKYLSEIVETDPGLFLKEMTPRAKLSSADQAAELGLDLNLPYHRKLQAEYAEKVLAVQRRLNQPAESTPRFNPADPEAKGVAARGGGRPPKTSSSSTLSWPTFEHLGAELAGAKIEDPPISSCTSEAVGAPAIVCPETPYKAIKFEVDAAGKKVVLGKGTGGTVYRASYMGVRVAVKELHLDEELTAAKELAFRKEAGMHSGIRHPNILLLMAVCLEAGHLALVMEYMDNGSLYNFLHSTKEISWAQRKRLAREMAAGLVCLHSLNIAHRDLKSLNVLLDEYCRAKLADFGLSVVKLNSLPSKLARGTPCWVAPEVITQNIMTSKSDIYSLGVILWELASREVPYSGIELVAIYGIANGITNEIPPETPTAFANVINDCWKFNPEERPSAEEVLTRLQSL